MTDEQLAEMERRLATCNRDLLAARGSIELLRQVMLRQGGVRGLDSELTTNVRVIEALREGIRKELKRARERLADRNQQLLPLDLQPIPEGESRGVSENRT